MDLYRSYKNNKSVYKKVSFYNLSGGTFKCVRENSYDDICVPTQDGDDGEYLSKDECMETCIISFIDNQMVHAEFVQWISFLGERIKAGNDVYVKGGTVLGLKVAQLLFNQIGDESKLDDLLELDLIKDWDFTIIGREIGEIDGKTNKMTNEGKTMKIYRYKGYGPRLEFDRSALFELSVKDDENFSDLEIPMTSMKIKLDLKNIKYIFVLALYFYLRKEDHDIKLFGNVLTKMNQRMVRDIIKNHIEVVVPDCLNGLFNTDPNTDLDTGGLNKELIDIIKNTTVDQNEQQFIVSHIKEPDRMIVRLFPKNIKKSEKISNFLKQTNIINQPWLLNRENIERLIDDFLNNLDSFIQKKYYDNVLKNYDDILKKNLLYIYNHMGANDPNKELIFNRMLEVMDQKINDSGRSKNKFVKEIQDIKSPVADFIDYMGTFYTNINLGRLHSLIKSMNMKDVIRIKKMIPRIPRHLIKQPKITKNKQPPSFNIYQMIQHINNREDASKSDLIDCLQSTKMWDDLRKKYDNTLLEETAMDVIGLIPSVRRFTKLADDVESLLMENELKIMPIYTTELCQVELGFWQKALDDKNIDCHHVAQTGLSFITSKKLDMKFNTEYVDDNSWTIYHLQVRLREAGAEEPDRFTGALMTVPIMGGQSSGPSYDTPKNILFIGIHLEADSIQKKSTDYFTEVVIPAIDRAKEEASKISNLPLSHIIILGDMNNVCRNVLHTYYGDRIYDPVLRFDTDYKYMNDDHRQKIGSMPNSNRTMHRYPVSGHGNPSIDGYDLRSSIDYSKSCGDTSDGRGTIDGILCIDENISRQDTLISGLRLLSSTDWDWVASQTFDKEPIIFTTSHNSDHVAVYATIDMSGIGLVCVSAAQLGIQKIQGSVRRHKNTKLIKTLFNWISAEKISSTMQEYIKEYNKEASILPEYIDYIENAVGVDQIEYTEYDIKNFGNCIGYISILRKNYLEFDHDEPLYTVHKTIIDRLRSLPEEENPRNAKGKNDGKTDRQIKQLEDKFMNINLYWRQHNTTYIFFAGNTIEIYKKKIGAATKIEIIKNNINKYTRYIYKYKELVDILFKKQNLKTTATTLLCDKSDKTYIPNWTSKNNKFHMNLVDVLASFLENANNYFMIPPKIIALTAQEEKENNRIFKLDVAKYLNVVGDPNPNNLKGYTELRRRLNMQPIYRAPIYGLEIDLKTASSYIMSLFIKTYTYEEIKSIGGYPLSDYELKKEVEDDMYNGKRLTDYRNILNMRIWNLLRACKININNLKSNYKLLDMRYLQRIVLADEFVNAFGDDGIEQLNRLPYNVWHINGEGIVFYFTDNSHRNNLKEFFVTVLNRSSTLGIKLIDYI